MTPLSRNMLLGGASIAVAALCAACASDLFSPDSALGKVAMVTGMAPQVDDAEEFRIGSTAAATLLGAAPLLAAPDVQKYVNRVGLHIARAGTRPDLAWEFGVLDTDTINAFAAPGGYVLISKGLLLRLNDEAELAGVLAHEITHVEQKHHLRALIQAGVVGNVASTGLSYATGGRSAGYGGDIATKVFTNLYSKGLSRSDELEADRRGMQLAGRAGYDAYGLIAVLQTLDAMNASDASLTLLLKTHPAAKDRLAELNAFAASNVPDSVDAPDGKERFRKIIAPLQR